MGVASRLRARAARGAASRRADRAAARQRRLDILVVEDNATNQKVVAHVLEQRGYHVTAVVHGPRGRGDRVRGGPSISS